jgi:hypothetical protein
MILGFFMLWDLPTITRGVASLRNSRLAPVHAELAPALTVFGKLFGRALEAQVRPALVRPRRRSAAALRGPSCPTMTVS